MSAAAAATNGPDEKLLALLAPKATTASDAALQKRADDEEREARRHLRPLTPYEDILCQILWLNDAAKTHMACQWMKTDLAAQYPDIDQFITNTFAAACEPATPLYVKQLFLIFALDQVPLFAQRIKPQCSPTRWLVAFPALTHSKVDVFIFGQPLLGYHRVASDTANIPPPAFRGLHSFLSACKDYCTE